MGGTTKYMGLTANGTYYNLTTTSQSAILATSVVTGLTGTVGTQGKVVVDLGTSKLVTDSPTLATAGSAIAAFTTIDSSSTNGIQIITDVSGGGTAGEVTTAGVAASLQTTVVTGLATSNTTATGRIPYVTDITSTNKLVTLQTTPASVGTAATIINGLTRTSTLTSNAIEVGYVAGAKFP